jgi:hypothetical protein
MSREPLTAATEAQAKAVAEIERPEIEIAGWMIKTSGRDHRRRPDIRSAPKWPELTAAVTRYTQLVNEGK